MSMEGKIVLVTGASQGIGKATAIGIAKQGATLTIVCRDPARGEAALADIKQQSGNDNVDMLLCDLSSQAEIRKLASEFQARRDKLHVLVNNAGAIFMNRTLTVDGYENTFATNHLNYFLLTHLLLDLLKKSAPARIVNVASAAHGRGRIDFDDLMNEKSYAGFAAYSDSKLANLVFTFELADRLAGSGVTANCLHPGVVSTGFGQNQPSWLKWSIKLVKPFFLSEEKGAATSVYLATSPEVEGVSGKYFDKSKPQRYSRRADNPETRKRLWDVSRELCKL
jgi:NAD(P)-dependent dehydrogenase (short-subunit alcohol dehydrogenase family)